MSFSHRPTPPRLTLGGPSAFWPLNVKRGGGEKRDSYSSRNTRVTSTNRIVYTGYRKTRSKKVTFTNPERHFLEPRKRVFWSVKVTFTAAEGAKIFWRTFTDPSFAFYSYKQSDLYLPVLVSLAVQVHTIIDQRPAAGRSGRRSNGWPVGLDTQQHCTLRHYNVQSVRSTVHCMYVRRVHRM